MDKPKKSLLVAAVLVAGAVSLVSLCRRAARPAAPRTPARLWKCTQCGHEFELSFEQTAQVQAPGAPRPGERPDPWSLPTLAPKGQPASPIETVPCPKCGGEAHRTLAFRCAECGEEFRHLEAVEPEPPDAAQAAGPPRVKPPRCPECASTRVVPR